ncbi:MAG: GNAT family N-acetyltransferase [Pirellulales bacterium]|nr:GNAT family N-acetyltransferase [Pirellulales bacterium]
MHVKLFTTHEPAYQQSLGLRNRHLRIPLGLDVFDEDLDAEKEELHIGLFDGETLLGSATLKDLGDGVVKLRQMVVDESRQGQGLGRKLIEGMESIAREKGFACIEMAARITARGFYENLGYTSEGESFLEVGIDHIRMVKRL